MQRWLLTRLHLHLWCWVGLSLGATAIATPINSAHALNAPTVEVVSGAIAARPRFACPTEFQPLVGLLLRDLPSYSNRVNQRLRRRNQPVNLTSNMLLTSPPDFNPLTLGPGIYQGASSEASDELHQVFFTTLERQYTAGKIVHLQRYHWVFLTQTVSGWRLAIMFSRTGPYRPNEPVSPPEDSSQGGTAQAIRNWLRDCQVGRIRPS